MPVATKKRPPMESEPGEGKSHEMKESPEDEIREGSESEEGEYPAKRGRKRSARGAKHTKAPMDGEGACCSAKKGRGKCAACASGKPCSGTMDGDCGMKKRSDALTPQEYLVACELGIQGRTRPYIRARLDAAERLDKKCGASGIAENKRCRIGTGGGKPKGSGLGTALKVIGTGAALATAATVGTAMYQNHQRKMQQAKDVIKSANEVRFKSNSGIRAAAQAARYGVNLAREGYGNPEANNIAKKLGITEEGMIQQGMQRITEAKQRRTAAYSDTRRALRELGSLVPESGARRRRRERGGNKPSPEGGTSIQRRTRRQGRVTRLNAMYADGFAVDLKALVV